MGNSADPRVMEFEINQLPIFENTMNVDCVGDCSISLLSVLVFSEKFPKVGLERKRWERGISLSISTPCRLYSRRRIWRIKTIY
jgi:hypothetical protein